MEHHSNIVPWHFLRERQGAVIKWAPVDDEGNFLIDEFEKLLTPRTKLVAITQMSNALGTIVPVKDVVKLAHARGIPVLVDGSQAAVHLASTCRTSTAISTSSPATSCTARPASACSTPSMSIWSRCAPSTAAAR
jgi:selenocysteine lyase/cysteine desulfurase